MFGCRQHGQGVVECAAMLDPVTLIGRLGPETPGFVGGAQQGVALEIRARAHAAVLAKEFWTGDDDKPLIHQLFVVQARCRAADHAQRDVKLVLGEIHRSARRVHAQIDVRMLLVELRQPR